LHKGYPIIDDRQVFRLRRIYPSVGLSLRAGGPAITVRPHLTKRHRLLYATAGSFDPRQNLDIVLVKYLAVSACRYLGRFEKSL
jgi:hypothetical protein